MQSETSQETSRKKSSEKKVVILGIQITDTSRDTKRYWFVTKGKVNPTNSTWFEVSEGEIVDESCDCMYESNMRFGKENPCKHLNKCKKVTEEMIK